LDVIRQLAVGHAAFTEHLPDLRNGRKELSRSIRRFHRIAWSIRRSILNTTAPFGHDLSRTHEGKSSMLMPRFVSKASVFFRWASRARRLCSWR
jgi:hypothetical protein